MTADEAVRIAKTAAEVEGWPWQEPIEARQRRAYVFFGPVTWQVTTNAESLGSNAVLLIDDTTGQVLQKAFAPR